MLTLFIYLFKLHQLNKQAHFLPDLPTDIEIYTNVKK